jgi:formylglycine-generating enzyme required for sulfatase activity
MEYVDGGSLLDRCRAGAIPVEEAIALTSQLCDGLGRAHSQGIIHRDIKPANILLTKDGLPKLTDFGLAKAESADTGMTMTGAVLGTLDFMPPEQRRDAALADARSDLWSLAATLYQMLTGKIPKIIKFNDVPTGLQSVLGKALEDAKEDRYQSASELKDALQKSRRDTSPVKDLEVGTCPYCNTSNPVSRKFCRECGGSLEASCLSCTGKVSIWEKICDSCGANQSSLLEQRYSKMLERQAEAELLLISHDYDSAKLIAEQFTSVLDPRLRCEKSWGDSFLSRVVETLDREIAHVTELMSEATKHRIAYDYKSAVRALEQVPDKLRACQIAGYSSTVAEELKNLRESLDEITRLNSLIKTRIGQKQLNGLLSEVESLLIFQPTREDLLKLKGKLIEREQKLITIRDESLSQAEKAYEKQDYQGCLALLDRIDPSLKDETFLRLYQNAAKANAQVAELDRQINSAVADKQYDGLLETVEQYLGLRRNDLERKRLREQLVLRLEKRMSLITEIVSQTIDLKNKAQFSSALSNIRRIPESLRTEEVASLENMCLDLQDRQQRAMDQIQSVQATKRFDEDRGEVQDYFSVLLQFPEVKDSQFEQLYQQYQKGCEQYKQQETEDRIRRKNIKLTATLAFSGISILLAGSLLFFFGNFSKQEDLASHTRKNETDTTIKSDAQDSEELTEGGLVNLSEGKESDRSSASEQSSEANESKGLPAEITNYIGMRFKLVSPGKFARSKNLYNHEVHITKPFYLGVYEVTQSEYQQVMAGVEQNKGDAKFPAFYESPWKGKEHVMEVVNFPATYVSWNDANEFCRRLSVIDGRKYSLPTEAQWEYACRSGTDTTYSFGSDYSQLGEYAWFGENSNNRVHVVGQKKPNAWGFYDMHGNVWEWCEDWFGDYPIEPNLFDPNGPAVGEARVYRGGCAFDGGAGVCGSANRNKGAEWGRAWTVGFRVALSAPKELSAEIPEIQRDTRNEQSGMNLVSQELPIPVLYLPCDSVPPNVNFTRKGGNYAEGKLGLGIRFDGVSFSEIDTNLPLENSPRSLGLWIKNIDGNVACHIINYGVFETAKSFGILGINGKWRFFDQNGGLDTGMLIDAEWHHHAITFDGRLLIYYIDGMVVASTEKQLNTATSQLRIGGLGDPVNNLTGTVDEINVFDVALTESQVQELFRRR